MALKRHGSSKMAFFRLTGSSHPLRLISAVSKKQQVISTKVRWKSACQAQRLLAMRSAITGNMLKAGGPWHSAFPSSTACPLWNNSVLPVIRQRILMAVQITVMP